jgi:iron(III) transport system substrate-binding protein
MAWLATRATTLAAALAFAAGACRGDGRTVLTVYSPHGKDLLEHFEREFEKTHDSIDVQWVDMGSQEVLDRLRAESANPQADVWFGAPAEIFARATREKLLEPYTPTWANMVLPEARDPDNFWFGTYLTPEVIAYNSEAVSAAEAPKDWDDVLDPKWKGKVIIRDPVASGSMRAIFAAQIIRSIHETGSPDSGFAWLRRLDRNTKEYVLNPTILYQKLARREGTVTLYNMPDIVTLTQRTKVPIQYVIPRSGTPLLVDGIGIVRGTKHRKAAEAFYEFVSTPEALQVAAERFVRIPARTDISDERLPAWIRQARSQIKPMPLDQRLLAEKLDEWMTYWDSHIRNSERGR